MSFIDFWIVCSMFNVTVVSIMQLKNPVSDKTHGESLLNNGLLGPISTIGCIVFLGYMSFKSLK